MLNFKSQNRLVTDKLTRKCAYVVKRSGAQHLRIGTHMQMFYIMKKSRNEIPQHAGMQGRMLNTVNRSSAEHYYCTSNFMIRDKVQKRERNLQGIGMQGWMQLTVHLVHRSYVSYGSHRTTFIWKVIWWKRDIQMPQSCKSLYKRKKWWRASEGWYAFLRTDLIGKRIGRRRKELNPWALKP